MEALKRLATAVAVPSYRAAFSSVAARSCSTAAAAAAHKVEPATNAANVPASPSKGGGEVALASLKDEAIVALLREGQIPAHRLEKDLGDATRATHIRRLHIVDQLAKGGVSAEAAMRGIPMSSFNEDIFYHSIEGANCENVIGYMPLPVGIVGPVPIDGKEYQVPMATTEGALVASTNRGCRAIAKAGGATTHVLGDGMTRAPLIAFTSYEEAAAFKAWAEDPANFDGLASAFNSTTRFGRLKEVQPVIAGRNVHLRLKCFTGDAMGMNMITKGTHQTLLHCQEHFPTMKVLALSGNFCTDKKPSAVNWVQGRGKSVMAHVHLPEEVLASTLKTTADKMVELNLAKNLVGSALAGSVGGFNAHASNVVTAVFLATGQDAAQNVESSTCMTLIEKDEAGTGIYASVTMPSIEVGTVGGGTSLPAQGAALDLLGIRGASREAPGTNSRQLARIVATTVLAGELSLMGALTSGDLLSAHIKLNRKPAGTTGAATGAAAASATGQSNFSTASTTTGVVVKSASASPGRRYFAAAAGMPATEGVDFMQGV